MRRNFILLTFLLSFGFFSAPVSAQGRKTSDFNDGWTFSLVKQGAERTEGVNTRVPGDALIPEETGDSENVHIPHDWAIR